MVPIPSPTLRRPVPVCRFRIALPPLPFPLPAAAPDAANIAYGGVDAATGSAVRRTLFRAYRVRACARAGVSRRRGSRA